MLRVKLISTVNGTATNSVGASETRAINQDCSKNSRQWNGRRNANFTASADIANNPPTARIAPEKLLPKVGIPGDQRSWTLCVMVSPQVGTAGLDEASQKQ
jgi:hypothetical protein